MSTIPDIAEAIPQDPVIAALQQLLGNRLSTATAVRDRHGRDESFHPAHSPDAVAFAESTAEAAEIVRLCAAHRRPVIPYGTGHRHRLRRACGGATRWHLH